MKVSFDFDDTLDKPSVQKFARELINEGIDVWICTSRFENYQDYYNHFENKEEVLPTINDDLFEIANDLS